jgi:hypothetical protein
MIGLLRGEALERFYGSLGVAVPPDVGSARVWVTDEGVKVKINGWVWSPPIGETEPVR